MSPFFIPPSGTAVAPLATTLPGNYKLEKERSTGRNRSRHPRHPLTFPSSRVLVDIDLATRNSSRFPFFFFFFFFERIDSPLLFASLASKWQIMNNFIPCVCNRVSWDPCVDVFYGRIRKEIYFVVEFNGGSTRNFKIR